MNAEKTDRAIGEVLSELRRCRSKITNLHDETAYLESKAEDLQNALRLLAESREEAVIAMMDGLEREAFGKVERPPCRSAYTSTRGIRFACELHDGHHDEHSASRNGLLVLTWTSKMPGRPFP